MINKFKLTTIAALLFCCPINGLQAGSNLAVTFEEGASKNHGFSAQQIQRGSIERGTDAANESNNVMLLSADRKKDGRVGKADLIHRFEQVSDGSTIRMSGDFMFPQGTPLNSLILMDLECAKCGPDTNPGIRLYLRDGRLRIDRSKIGIKDPFLPNSRMTLKNGEWYSIEWIVDLDQTKNGHTTVSVNGETVLDRHGITLLSQEIIKRYTKRKVISAVDRFQIGLTANSNKSKARLLLDNVSFEIY